MVPEPCVTSCAFAVEDASSLGACWRTRKEAVPLLRIVDLLSDVLNPKEIVIDAASPEKAAELALGVSLTRSGARRNLRARVYTEQAGQPPSMVRLYGRVDDEAPK